MGAHPHTAARTQTASSARNAPTCRFLPPMSPSGDPCTRPTRRGVNSPQPRKRGARSVHRLCTDPLQVGRLCWSERCSSITSTSKGHLNRGYSKLPQRHRRANDCTACGDAAFGASEQRSIMRHVLAGKAPLYGTARVATLPSWCIGAGPRPATGRCAGTGYALLTPVATSLKVDRAGEQLPLGDNGPWHRHRAARLVLHRTRGPVPAGRRQGVLRAGPTLIGA
jgi:hypothetical protein